MPPNGQFPPQSNTQPMPENIQVIPNTPVATTTPVIAPASQPMTNSKEKPATPRNPHSVQNSLLLSELRDGMVIMADGSFRAVVACNSINFDLMSSAEREGVEFSYQNFLNSLTFDIQVFIRSQRIDIGPYIDHLVEMRRSQDNMLLGVLMDDYIDFIDSVSKEANIMDKSFFIAIPYYPDGNAKNVLEQGRGFFEKIFSHPKNTVTKIDTATYEKAKETIKNRVDSVTSGLYQVGVRSAQLGTKQLGELYYNVYNPDTAVRQPLANFEDVTSTYIKKAPTTGTAKPVTFGSSS